MAETQLTVKQVRSAIGAKPKHKGTLRALGLGRIGKHNTLPDRPEIRGMLRAVRHLVEFEEQAKPKKTAPKKTESKEAEPKKAASKTAESKQAAPKKAASKAAESKKAAPKKAAPKKAASKAAEPKKAAPKQTKSK